jgi:glutaconate CoA-transferase subunit B
MTNEKLDYSIPKLMACCGARSIRDHDLVVVGTGFPSIAASIALYTHAPNALLMQESGVFDARPKRPAFSVGDPCLNPGAAMVGGLIDVMGMFLQGGWVDVSYVSGSQVDKYGNINTTVIGDYNHPKIRLPGSGGANPLTLLSKRTLIITLHNDKRLAEKVDFITSPGYIDGPGAREKWGFPPGTGPEMIITNKAILKFDEVTKEAYLFSYHATSSVEEVLSLTPWDLKVSPDVHVTPAPTPEELKALKEKVDPNNIIDIVYGPRGYV